MNIVFISRCLIKKCNILNKKNKYLSRREKSQSLNCLGKPKLNKQTIQFIKVEKKNVRKKKKWWSYKPNTKRKERQGKREREQSRRSKGGIGAHGFAFELEEEPKGSGRRREVGVHSHQPRSINHCQRRFFFFLTILKKCFFFLLLLLFFVFRFVRIFHLRFCFYFAAIRFAIRLYA